MTGSDKGTQELKILALADRLKWLLHVESHYSRTGKHDSRRSKQLKVCVPGGWVCKWMQMVSWYNPTLTQLTFSPNLLPTLSSPYKRSAWDEMLRRFSKAHNSPSSQIAGHKAPNKDTTLVSDYWFWQVTGSQIPCFPVSAPWHDCS